MDMSRTRLLILYCVILFLASITLAYRAWTESRHATVIVEWSTSSELDTAGFNLYRIDASGHSDHRVNEYLIPASTDPLIGGEYAYEDKDVTPGISYQYELEEVENSGGITRYGPIEVTAESGGKLEMVLALVLSIFCVLGIVVFLITRGHSKKEIL